MAMLLVKCVNIAMCEYLCEYFLAYFAHNIVLTVNTVCNRFIFFVEKVTH